jgi:hypothetical protein
MNHKLEAAVGAYKKVQQAERACAKANHELHRALIQLGQEDLDEYYRQTTEFAMYEEQTHRMYP